MMEWKATGTLPGARDSTNILQAGNGREDGFAAVFRVSRLPMLITDPHLDDNPIVFVNDAFLRLTGYERDEVVGRNCRFLQGPETDRGIVQAIAAAIRRREDIEVDILNYRKDGSTFWNALQLSPVIDEAGALLFFASSQLDVTDRKEAELRATEEKALFERAVEQRTLELEAALEAKTALLHEVDHRVKNNLQMVSSLIVMQARTIPDNAIKQSLHAMLTRIEALSAVHRRLYEADDLSRFEVAEFLPDLVSGLVAASPHDKVETKFDLQSVEVAAGRAAPIALIVNELVTNALKHAFQDQPKPALTVRLKDHGQAFCIEVEDNGPGFEGDPPQSSFGMKLIRSLCRQLRAEVAWHNQSPGTRVQICMPHDGAAASSGKEE